MEPLLKYDQEHTIPKFRANPCPRDGGDHIDIWYCCSFVELAEYIDWFEKTQLPFGFKNDDFNCLSSKNWSYMHLSKRYELQNDLSSVSFLNTKYNSTADFWSAKHVCLQ